MVLCGAVLPRTCRAVGWQYMHALFEAGTTVSYHRQNTLTLFGNLLVGCARILSVDLHFLHKL